MTEFDNTNSRVGWIELQNITLVIPKDYILDSIVAEHGLFEKGDVLISSRPCVRLLLTKPEITFIEDDFTTAERLKDFLRSSRKIVTLKQKEKKQ